MKDTLRAGLDALPENPLSPKEAEAFAEEVVDTWAQAPNPVPRRRPVLLALAAGVALAVGLAWWSQPAPEQTPNAPIAHAPASPPQNPAQITASEGARYSVDGPLSARVVRLQEGSVFSVVDARGPGESFRVQVGEATVEVHGTRFGVTAMEGELESVWVEDGEVALTLPSGETVDLHAGEEWPKEQPPVTTPPILEGPGAPAPAPALAPVQEAPRDTAGQALSKGLALLDAGQAAAAAEALSQEPQDSPLYGDALYWRAVSLSQAGQSRPAQAAFEAFLAHSPSSPRAGLAHCLLARLMGSEDPAQTHLQAAANSPNPQAKRCAAQSTAGTFLGTPQK